MAAGSTDRHGQFGTGHDRIRENRRVQPLALSAGNPAL
jgi:hypothetical protein